MIRTIRGHFRARRTSVGPRCKQYHRCSPARVVSPHLSTRRTSGNHRGVGTWDDRSTYPCCRLDPRSGTQSRPAASYPRLRSPTIYFCLLLSLYLFIFVLLSLIKVCAFS